MEVMSATNLVGLQRAQSDGVTLRIRIFVALQIKFGWIACRLAKSSGRPFRASRIGTGLNPDLTRIALQSGRLWRSERNKLVPKEEVIYA